MFSTIHLLSHIQYVASRVYKGKEEIKWKAKSEMRAKGEVQRKKGAA